MTQFRFYNENDALNHVKSLEFPRLAGSKGEKKAINYITMELKKENIKPELQSFIWCKSITILMRLAFIFILINIIIFE
ncbi:MAG: hypothetical protein ACTSQG_02685, partial [Promethearchaeota archaeon]